VSSDNDNDHGSDHVARSLIGEISKQQEDTGIQDPAPAPVPVPNQVELVANDSGNRNGSVDALASQAQQVQLTDVQVQEIPYTQRRYLRRLRLRNSFGCDIILLVVFKSCCVFCFTDDVVLLTVDVILEGIVLLLSTVDFIGVEIFLENLFFKLFRLKCSVLKFLALLLFTNDGMRGYCCVVVIGV